MGSTKRLYLASLLLIMISLLAVLEVGLKRVNSASAFANPVGRSSWKIPKLIGRLLQVSAPVQLTLPSLSASVGQTLSIDLLIDTSEATRAAQFGLEFNPDVLRCEDVEQGSFYSDWAAANGASTFVFPTPTCDNTNGRVTPMGIIVIGGSGGPTGLGVLATFTFTVLSEGISPLTLVDVAVADDSPSGNPLSVDFFHGQVLVGSTPTVGISATITPTATLSSTPTSIATTVQPGTATASPTPTGTPAPSATGSASPSPTASATASATATITPSPTATYGVWSCADADVNLDGMVNILDISLIAQRMFETGPPGWIREDVNRDGVVNVLDITSSGACMDELPTPTFTPTVTPTPVPEAHIWIDPGSQTITSGQDFTINLVLNTIAPSRAAQFALSFNPAVIRCNDVEEGTFYSSWAAANGASTLVLPQGTCDNNLGQVTIMGITVLGGSGGATGQGVVASFEFTALANDSSPLTLIDVIVADDDVLKAEALPLRISNGVVSVANSTQPSASLTLSPNPTATSTITPQSSGNPTATRTLTRTPTRTATQAGSSNPTATTGGGNPTATFTASPTATGPTSAASPTQDVGPSSTPPVSRTNTPAASSARIFFEPSQKTIAAAGETFTIDVVIETDKKSRSAMMKISFNPSVLECTDLEEGGFYKTWATANSGQTYMHPNPPVIDNAGGKIEDFGITILLADDDPRLGYAGGPTGKGVFVTLTFRSKANGISALQMENVILGDDQAEAQPLAVTTQNGQVFVGVTPTATQQGAATATPTRTLPASNATSPPQATSAPSQRTATPIRATGLPAATPIRTSGAPAPTSAQATSASTTTSASSGSGTPFLTTSPAMTPTGTIASDHGEQTPTSDLFAERSLSEDASTDSGSIDISASLDASGVTTEDVSAQSQDGLCALSIPIDTQALTADNYPLESVSLNSIHPDSLPSDLRADLTGSLCEYGPPGAYFYPPAIISLAYQAENIPVGARERDLIVLLFEEDSGEWLPLETTADPAQDTVSAEIDHFSIYAIRAVQAAFNWTPIIIASVFIEMVLGLGVVWFIHYHRGRAVPKSDVPPLLLPPIAGQQYIYPTVEEKSSHEHEQALLQREYWHQPVSKTNLSKENEEQL